MKYQVSDFYYELPQELIAQVPLAKRDDSRLLVVDPRQDRCDHRHFYDLVEELKAGDLLVMNDTKVLPARLLGHREATGGAIELLLLTRRSQDVWECLAKPGKSARPGHRFQFGDGLLKAEVAEVLDNGNRLVRFEYQGVFEEILDQLGEMPLPPYIHEKLKDRNRYQTVYAKEEGSAAAPTAGLHFTQDLLLALQAKGVEVASLTLHVGLGTFRPVKVKELDQHLMHSEFYSLSEEAAEAIQRTKEAGGRVVCVGTTSLRTLEAVYESRGRIEAASGWTDIFIYPGKPIQVVDALITNFHLPESTLIMLVAAFLGYERTMAVYDLAVREKYRFFSFGDAMFLVHRGDQDE